MDKKVSRGDYFTRLISLLLAIGLWLYVVYAENPEIEVWVRGVNVTIINGSRLTEKSLTLLSGNDLNSISVKIKGRRKNINLVNASNITAEVNLGAITKEGNYLLPIEINIPIDGVEVTDKDPYNSTVNVDNLTQQQKPIRIAFEGTPKENYSMEDYTASLSFARVKGAQTIVNDIKEAVATVNISEVSETADVKAQLKLIKNDGTEYKGDAITLLDTAVNVKTGISLTKTVKISPALNTADGIDIDKIKLSPETIKIKGDPKVISAIEQVATEPISISEIQENFVITKKLVIPSSVTTVDNISEVKLEISFIKKAEVTP